MGDEGGVTGGELLVRVELAEDLFLLREDFFLLHLD